jgi:hypothetical protein
MQKYEPFSKREALQQRVSDSERILSKSEQQGGIANLNPIRKRLQQDRERLVSATPPDVDGQIKDKVKLRLNTLESAIKHGRPREGHPPMPSRQQMEGNGVGDADQHYQWEQWVKNHNVNANGDPMRIDPRKGQQGMWDEWKDHRRTMYKDREEYARDLASVEVLRPDKSQKSEFMNYDRKSYMPIQHKTAEQVAEITGGEVNPISKLADEMPNLSPIEMLDKANVMPTQVKNQCCGLTASGSRCKTYLAAGKTHCKRHKE